MIGIIGAGNMGMAIAKRINGKVLISDIDKLKLRAFKDNRIAAALNNIELVRHSNIVILSVKPQDFTALLKEIKPYVKSKLVISIAAGINTAFIERILCSRVRVIRVMPNMPSAVGKGISAITTGRFAGFKDIRIARSIFLKLGEVVEIKENLMDAVTAVSGSGPAYYFLFTALLEKAACANGLGKGIASRLARATFIGAAEVAKGIDFSMDDFIKKVASKGGTTEIALKVFKEYDLEGIVKKAVTAARKKSCCLNKKITRLK